MNITIGTRQSNLALWQTHHVRDLLLVCFPDATITLRHFVTKGDKTLDKPLPEIGGKGLFTLELERALLAGEIDLAVHSLKDLPVENPAGLQLGAIIGRADPRDVLIATDGRTLATLPPGATVGTSSLRRQAQLLIARPDLVVRSIRGNVETRINKVMRGDYDAAVLAKAGIDRLGLNAHVTEILPLETMLPAPGQGALGVQCRADDPAIHTLLHQIDCPDVRVCVTAERTFLHALNAGCSAPVAAYATLNEGTLQMQTFVATNEGIDQTTIVNTADDPVAVAKQIASQVALRLALTDEITWTPPSLANASS